MLLYIDAKYQWSMHFKKNNKLWLSAGCERISPQQRKNNINCDLSNQPFFFTGQDNSFFLFSSGVKMTPGWHSGVKSHVNIISMAWFLRLLKSHLETMQNDWHTKHGEMYPNVWFHITFIWKKCMHTLNPNSEWPVHFFCPGCPFQAVCGAPF